MIKTVGGVVNEIKQDQRDYQQGRTERVEKGK